MIILVDEQRFSPPYEDDSIKEWRKKYLKGQNFLRSNGVEFNNHYVASSACSPSRATLYTGQYPSLHGVTQTDMGEIPLLISVCFGLILIQCHLLVIIYVLLTMILSGRVKWHASHADIIVPGTHDSYLSYDDKTGIPIPKKEGLYLNADRLDKYGFNG